MTSQETKRRYDRVQRALASIAKARRLAREAGQEWAIMDPRERNYQQLKAHLELLEGEA